MGKYTSKLGLLALILICFLASACTGLTPTQDISQGSETKDYLAYDDNFDEDETD